MSDYQSINKKKLTQIKFSHHYQAILQLDNWKQYGSEALIRCGLDPNVFFQYVINENRLYEFDTLSICKAVKHYCRKGNIYQPLFVNIFPSTIGNENFIPFINNFIEGITIDIKNLVFDINVTFDHKENIDLIFDQIKNLKKLGYSIAIDGVGTNFETFKKMASVNPDYIKTDFYFAKDLWKYKYKQRSLLQLMEYCSDEIKLILKGVDSPEDLAISKYLGIQLAQGFIISKPKQLI